MVRAGVFTRLGRLAVAKPKVVLGAAAVFFVLAGLAGGSVARHLSTGGLDDTGSQATRAAAILNRVFHQGSPDVALLVRARHGTVDDPAVAAAGTALTSELAAQPGVEQATSYWSLARVPPLRSKDGTTALVFGRVPGNQNHQNDVLKTLSPRFGRTTQLLEVRVTGFAEVFRQVTSQVQDDLKKAELIAVPLSMILLLFVFRGFVASALPLAVGGLAVVGTMFILRAVAATTEVSIFALNLTTGMGLGLGIDYSLLLVSRYREEVARTGTRDEAVIRTVETAGRTVAFSALTVAASLTALLVFPLVFLRSFAYAGIPVVLVAAVGAIVVLPAILVVLGPRVDALSVNRRPLPPVGEGFWHRVATVVMRRPVPIATVVIVVLVVLGTPFLHVHFGFPDDRVLPSSAAVSTAGQELRQDFPSSDAFPIWVVAPSSGSPTSRTGDIDRYAAALSQLQGVGRVDAFTGSYVRGNRVIRLASYASGFAARDATYLTVVPSVEPYSTQGEDVVHHVRALAAPFPVQVGGRTAALIDNKAAAFGRMPLAGGIIVLVSFVVLFALFGSVIVPVKAFLLNLLSLSATFGAMVWIFQDGHLSGILHFTPTGTIDLSTPILMFCVAFGLSMDYEVFLLSRVKEEYDRTGDNAASIALGLERSGRIITAAALLLAAVFLAFATSGVAFIKLFGVGLALAIAMDATIVRGALAPAFMRVAGDLNWWAPAPLRRLHDRFGAAELPTEPEPAPAVGDGRPLSSADRQLVAAERHEH
ncbi:MAG: MMPL family transporter [Actinobacteria bacterium]|nr:MAG: MMPL family transporter [Actinomycetota bacterium]